MKESVVQQEPSRISKRVALAILAVLASGCKGSLEGKVLGTDSEPAVPVTGHPVFLVAASGETAAALRTVCPAAGDTTAGARMPLVPTTLIETLALKEVPSGDDGSYAFHGVPPGRYLVAVELSDGYRWLPVQIGRRRTVVNVTPGTSREGCEIAGAM